MQKYQINSTYVDVSFICMNYLEEEPARELGWEEERVRKEEEEILPALMVVAQIPAGMAVQHALCCSKGEMPPPCFSSSHLSVLIILNLC